MKKLVFVLSLVLTLATFVPQIVSAQTHKVTVVVVDTHGERLPGAAILVAGSSTTAVTDQNGVATLECAPNSLLIISYVGYKTALVPVSDWISITVELEEDVENLEG